MSRGGLSEHLNENELDLSMLQYEVVPVAVKKATQLDLSANSIRELPQTFASSLTRLVKLDLSKNRLEILPDNINLLQNLHTLDLYANRLTSLPVSIFEMKNLKWLDLKDNPLNAELKAVAGDCLDKKECERCAKDVREYYANVNVELEKKKVKKLKKERKREALRNRLEEEEAKKKKEIQKLEKERRRQEFLRKKEENTKSEEKNNKDVTENETKTEKDTNSDQPKIKPSKRNNSESFTLKSIFVIFLVALISLLVSLWFYCSNYNDILCTEGKYWIEMYWKKLQLKLK
ncbi:DgyrCDS9018 [Dimorphilus gyrociliatus]|uniref:DgyrCDS9018 n=1 Tax=Dimorphilus gyrociliatus TaxID=2664684 RepID=A0A7I8VX42_9ANNE|nr:DgyrCDS9018 [Dimorphilus gyrociliatus]